MKTIIGLAGRAGSGKTYLAEKAINCIPNAYPFSNNIYRMSFAAPIKKMLEVLIGLDAYNSNKEIINPILGHKTVRYALQTLGTEWGRNLIDPDIWINYLKHQIDSLKQEHIIILIDDVRFENEVKAIQDLGGRILAIHNPHLKHSTTNHDSERLGLSRFEQFTNEMNECSVVDFCKIIVGKLEQNISCVANLLSKESE